MSSVPTNSVKYCRLCANNIQDTSVKDLFDKSNALLIKKILDLTGLTIRDNARLMLPRYICSACKEDLARAYEFRRKIIKTQRYFKSKKYKSKIGKEEDLKPAFDFVQLNEYDMHENSDEKKDGSIRAAECVEVVIKTEIKERKSQNIEDTCDVNNSNIKSPNKMLALKEEHADVSEKKESEDTRRKKLISQVDRMESTDSNVSNDSNSEYTPSEISDDSDDKELVMKTEKTPKKELNNSTTKEKEEPDILENRQFSCYLCQRPIETLVSLKMHFQQLHKGEKFKCDQCEEKFLTTKSMVRHFRLHQGEREFKCHYCDMSFKYTSGRCRHERRMHAKDPPFLCVLCGKTFITTEMGRNHMTVHTKERAYRCTVCKADFLRKSHLTTHYRSMTHKNNAQKLSGDLSAIDVNDSQQSLGIQNQFSLNTQIKPFPEDFANELT